jgi:hypothetical protein
MIRARNLRHGKTLWVESLEPRQMLTAQPTPGAASLPASHAANLKILDNTGSNNSRNTSTNLPVSLPTVTITDYTTADSVYATTNSGDQSSSSDSKSKSQPAADFASSVQELETSSVWQSGTYAVGASTNSLDTLTSPYAAPDPIRFQSLSDNTPTNHNSNSLFSQVSVLEWQPGQLAGDPSAQQSDVSFKAIEPTDGGLTSAQDPIASKDLPQAAPTIFGEQWGHGIDPSNRWVLRDGSAADRFLQQAISARKAAVASSIREGKRAIGAPTHAVAAAIGVKACSALAYFARLGGAIGTVGHADTALTAQRIQQLLLACRRATVDTLQLSIRTPWTASTKVAALVIGTVLASRSSRQRGRKKHRWSGTEQELLAASGAGMSRSWIWLRVGPPRSSR